MKSEKQFSNQGNAQNATSQGHMSTPEYLLNNLTQQNLTSDSVAEILDSLPPGQIVRYFAQNGLEALFEQQEETTEDNYGSNATALELNNTLDASIDAEMESDLYSIELEEGVNYTFSVTSDELSSPYLVLRDSNGERISSDFQDEGEAGTSFNFTAPASGTFYLDFSDLEDQASGTYNISVTTEEPQDGSETDPVDETEEPQDGSETDPVDETEEPQDGSETDPVDETEEPQDGSETDPVDETEEPQDGSETDPVDETEEPQDGSETDPVDGNEDDSEEDGLPVTDEDTDPEEDNSTNQDGSEVISGEDSTSQDEADVEDGTDVVVDEDTETVDDTETEESSADTEDDSESPVEDDSTNQDGSDVIAGEESDVDNSETENDTANQDGSDVIVGEDSEAEDNTDTVEETVDQDNSDTVVDENSDTVVDNDAETDPAEETEVPQDGEADDEIASEDLAADSTTTGALAANAEVQGTFEQANDSDWFAMDLEAGTDYTMTFSAENAEIPALVLRDAEGQTIENNFNITGDSVEISFTAEESGSFFLDAMDLSGGVTGDYTLALTTAEDDVIEIPELGEDDISADILTTSLLDLGSTVESALDFGGDEDWFATSLEAGMTYDVSLESDTLESGLLSVMDSEGELAFALEEGNENGVLSFTAEESGTYFIAASDANPDATGDYLIGVQQQSETDVIA